MSKLYTNPDYIKGTIATVADEIEELGKINVYNDDVASEALEKMKSGLEEVKKQLGVTI